MQITERKTTASLRAEQTSGNMQSSSIAWLGEGLRCLLLFPVLRLVAPLTVEGIEHIQGEGPYIFAVNHTSHLDTPILLAALPRDLRLRVRVAAAADYFFTSRWKGMLVRTLLGAFAFERKSSGCLSSIACAEHIIHAGQSLVLFPEGTRAQDGHLQHFKWGVGKLALATGVQVIPTYIEGTFAALPKGVHWPRRHHVTVRLGAPLTFAAGSSPTTVASAIEHQVRALAACKASSEQHEMRTNV